MNQETLLHAVQLPAEHVIIYYDGPRLYTVHTKTGQLLLANDVDEDETSEIWVFMELSKANARELFTGKITLRESMLNGKNPLYEVRFSGYRHENPTVTTLPHDKVPTEWLPDKDSFLIDFIPEPETLI
jgi:hydroxymethylpyrimidine pyrophosphatase-like HAD family hydrolase